jgi:hypothetical protein
VIVAAAVIALPKGTIIPKMRREIPSIGHFEDMHVEKFKGPPRRAFINRDLRTKDPKSSGPE